MISDRLLVAVVDDEESVLRALARLIRSAGLDAEVYSSGEAFLGALGRVRPDCVVLDLHMPGINGFEVQARIGQSRFPVPVIAMTGHDTLGAEERMRGAGAVAYVRKPVDKQTLLEAIGHAVLAGPGEPGAAPAGRDQGPTCDEGKR